MIKAQGLDRARLIGVGVSIPLDFGTDGRWLPHQLFPDLDDPHLEARFERILGPGVILENDGRVCAIAERMMGIGKAYRTIMLIHIGHGVGGGIIIDGKPYRGALAMPA